MAVLYIVATPIGNLQDITFRAVETLKRVDLILCEDTRVTQKLLSHYEIKTPTLSYHQHSKLNKIEYILDLLKQGKNLALVSDAGTPGISDPGGQLVAQVAPVRIAQVQPVPGPSALIAIASISGFPVDRFLFLGFPPIKNKRKKFFEEVAASRYPVIFYESPYRIIKTLNEIDPLRDVVVGRELTKKFETIYRGKAKDVLNQLTKEEIRGEFVVIVRAMR
ncbi:MAG: 16S rRNA (cytidine(1402)-2'-O)-methyltransferase [Patescibacteria group bacterium]